MNRGTANPNSRQVLAQGLDAGIAKKSWDPGYAG